ncbi:MAG: PhnE/PtxC family ABC transporter permease, partial [Candidatus Limnocylindria bacterium]
MVIAGAVAAAAIDAGVGRAAVFNPAGWPQVGQFFSAALHPRMDASFLSLTADATLTTLAYAVLGTALSLVLGLFGGVLSSQVWWRSAAAQSSGGSRPARWRAGWLAARAGLALPRGIHEVVWGLFLLSVFGINPLVAILAIGLPFGAVTAKVFSEILDESPEGPFAALRASGAGRRAARRTLL